MWQSSKHHRDRVASGILGQNPIRLYNKSSHLMLRCWCCVGKMYAALLTVKAKNSEMDQRNWNSWCTFLLKSQHTHGTWWVPIIITLQKGTREKPLRRHQTGRSASLSSDPCRCLACIHKWNLCDLQIEKRDTGLELCVVYSYLTCHWINFDIYRFL